LLLLVIVVLTPLIALWLVPRLRRGSIAGNERAVLDVLRAIEREQERFRAAGHVDQDGDGQGEYGTLGELLGLHPCRGSGRRIRSWPGDLELQRRPTDNGVVLVRDGYCYRLYLPTASGPAVGDRAIPLAASAADADRQEQRYLVYAWPELLGVTGRLAFVGHGYWCPICNKHHPLVTANVGYQEYAGLRRMPAPGAALTAEGNQDPDRLEGTVVMGPAADGGIWIGPG
jgi:hypothetical protein